MDIKNFESLSICEAEKRLKKLKEEEKLKLLSPTTEVKPSQVAQLTKEKDVVLRNYDKLLETVEELKKADEYSNSLREIQLKERDEEIAELKKKLEEQQVRWKDGDVLVLKEYVKSQIDHELTKDIHSVYNGQVDIRTYGYMSELFREKFYEIVDECIEEMTTYESNGCGAYRNGYWYDKNLGEYELQHKGGCIVWEAKESDEEDSDED